MSSVWYGSLTNRLAERSKSPMPEVGMGATELLWSDSYAFEIIAVKDDRHCTVRELGHKMKEGTDWYDQEYDYFTDMNGSIKNLFKTKKGFWVERYSNGSYGDKFALGYARFYQDPSF